MVVKDHCMYQLQIHSFVKSYQNLKLYLAHRLQSRSFGSWVDHSVSFDNRLFLLLTSCSSLDCISSVTSGSVKLNVAPLFSTLFNISIIMSPYHSTMSFDNTLAYE